MSQDLKFIRLAFSDILGLSENAFERGHFVDPDDRLLLWGFEFAKRNKLGYIFCKNCLQRFKITSTACRTKFERHLINSEIEIRRLEDTIALVKEKLDSIGVDFLVIKTIKRVPYCTWDLDIFIRRVDLPLVLKTLIHEGARQIKEKRHETLYRLGIGHPGYQLKDLTVLDVYTAIPWNDWPAFDEEYLFRNARVANVGDTGCPIPNDEADVLSLITSYLFTGRGIPLLEAIHINMLMEEGLNIKDVAFELENYGWSTSFLEILNHIHLSIVKIRREKLPNTNFPLKIPLSILLRSISGSLSRFANKRGSFSAKILAELAFNSFIAPTYMEMRSYLTELSQSILLRVRNESRHSCR